MSPLPQLVSPERHHKHEEVERFLLDLQNRYRLAIHVWEYGHPLEFPCFSWNAINEVAAGDIRQKLQFKTMPLMSMSLLHSINQPTLVPYNTKPGVIGNFAYLINMDQAKTHSPKVVFAAPHILYSGEDIHNKDICLKSADSVSGLKKLYSVFKSKGQLMEAAAGPERKVFTERQLELLGKHEVSASEATQWLPRGASDPALVDCNEILVAAAKPHVAAIAVPLWIGDDSPKWAMPMIRLGAAIAGLQHVDKGLDVPLVFYHLTGHHKGRFKYAASGKGELIDLAISNLEELNSLGLNSFQAFKDNNSCSIDIQTFRQNVCKALGGIDLYMPLSAQEQKIQALKAGQCLLRVGEGQRQR